MWMTGTIVNSAAVLVCGLLGSLLRRGIPERFKKTVLQGLSLCVIYIGISGALQGQEILIEILAMALGALLGEWIDLDRLLSRLGERLERSFGGADAASGTFARGFVSCSLIFCVGSMAILGAIEDSMGYPSTLLAKTVIDAFTCFMMATSLGVGCAFSAFLILLYQGAVSLLALCFFSAVPAAILTEMSAVGSLTILAVGLNLLGVTQIKTANLIPAIFLPLLLCPLFL